MKAGAILAGGLSKRFGQDKRFFKLGEKTLIEIACDKIRKVFERKYLITNENFKYKTKGFTVIKDKIPQKGPLIGIHSLFSETNETGCVFIPIDMPFLTEELIKYISELSRYDVVYINFGGKIYPIPGYYSRKVQPIIEDQIRAGDFSLKSLLSKIINKTEINEDDLTKFGNPKILLFNINSPEDLKDIEILSKEYDLKAKTQI